jgi:hypothetical protein
MNAPVLRLRVLPAIPPINGREIELRTTATHIQSRLQGDDWTDLIALAELVGPEGDNIILRVDSDQIQWKPFSAPDDEWVDLVPLADITGPQGVPGEKGDTGDQGPPGQDSDLTAATLFPGTRAELKAIDPSENEVAILCEGVGRLYGRFGQFRWRTGDFTREVTADTMHATYREGVYVESSLPGFDRTVGCWVRDFEGPVSVAWYGAVLDRVTDDTEAFNAATYAYTEFLPGGVSAANNDRLLRRTIIVPNGDAYLAGTVYVRKGQHLHADGLGATRIISPVNTRSEPTVRMGFGKIGGVDVIDPGGLPPSISGFCTEGGPTMAPLVECRGLDGAGIAGAYLHDMFITTAPWAVRAAGGDVAMTRVIMDNGSRGVELEGSRNSITACHFFFNDIAIRASGPLADWIISGCTFAFQKIQDISLRTAGTTASAWSNSTNYAIGERALDGTTVYQAVIAQTAPGSGTFADYRAANPSVWVRVAMRAVKIVNNTFTDNAQNNAQRSAAIDLEASLQEAQVEIVGNTFSNMQERAIRGASQGTNEVTIKRNVFNGLRPNQRYFQSTTSRGILVGGGKWTIGDNEYLNLHGQPIEINVQTASSRITIDGEKWRDCAGTGGVVSITNLTAGATLDIDNCRGDDIKPLIAASNHAGVSIGDGNKKWLGAPTVVGARQYYLIPTFHSAMRTIKVTAQSGANANWRRSEMFAVERGVTSPSGTQTDFVKATKLHASDNPAGGMAALDVAIEIGAIGGGQVISPAAFQIGSSIVVSVPDTYTNFKVAA